MADVITPSASQPISEERRKSSKTNAAPPPPVTILQQHGTSVIRITPGNSRTSGNSSRNNNNFPDVLDTEHMDVHRRTSSSGSRIGSDSNLPPEDDAVVPDYPMDSLPRAASGRSEPGSHSNSSQATISSESSSRSNIENNQTNIVVNVLRPSGLLSTSGERQTPSGSGATSNGSGSSPGTGSSNVLTVSSDTAINRSSQPSQPAIESSSSQIRTQDLSVGVVSSRVDHQRIGTLPDLLAHSQSASALPTATLPTIHNPSSSDHRRISEPPGHSRHRPHQDPRAHRSGHHGRSRRHSNRHSVPDSPCEDTCMKCVAVTTSFRWILVTLSLLGVCCVVTGIVLAALHAAGNSFLFLAIMFIGLGVLLVVVVGVGWKCTPRGHEPLHALFNLGNFRRPRSTSSRRRRSHHRRDGRWYGGVMYPEFQYRRPPPSYNASMQEYQQQQLAIAEQRQRDSEYDPDNLPDEDYSLPSSPPPSYRSRASTVRTGIQITFPPNQGGDYPESRPPTYRSHSSTVLGVRRTRPMLPRDDDDDDDVVVDQAPGDVAFTDSVFVDVNRATTSGTVVTTNQNVTVSVPPVTVTVSVMSQSGASAPSTSTELPPSLPITQKGEPLAKSSEVAMVNDGFSSNENLNAENDEPDHFDTQL